MNQPYIKTLSWSLCAATCEKLEGWAALSSPSSTIPPPMFPASPQVLWCSTCHWTPRQSHLRCLAAATHEQLRSPWTRFSGYPPWPLLWLLCLQAEETVTLFKLFYNFVLVSGSESRSPLNRRKQLEIKFEKKMNERWLDSYISTEIPAGWQPHLEPSGTTHFLEHVHPAPKTNAFIQIMHAYGTLRLFKNPGSETTHSFPMTDGIMSSMLWWHLIYFHVKKCSCRETASRIILNNFSEMLLCCDKNPIFLTLSKYKHYSSCDLEHQAWQT